MSLHAENLEPLAHQVAGHRPKEPDGIKTFYQAPNGTILKHLHKRTYEELEFYRLVFEDESTDPILKELRKFLPKYFGTFQLDLFPDEYFIKLEDATHYYEKPCIADIKIGRQFYHPTAPPEKIEYEKFKYPKLTRIGFRMGFRVYRPFSDTSELHDHKSLVQLENTEFLEKGFGSFFNLPEKLRKDAILAMLVELKEIRNWFERQRNFSFYATSLLCVYEGKRPCELHQGYVVHGSNESSGKMLGGNRTTNIQSCPHGINNVSDDKCNKCCTNVKTNGHSSHRSIQLSSPPKDGCIRVKMIDFHHVHTATERDDNYLFGLDNLIKCLEKLLTDY